VAAPCSRHQAGIYAAAAVQVKTLKIGTRGSPLALAQAYLTRDLLKVCLCVCVRAFQQSMHEHSQT
jgi:hypothetical protein